MFSQSSFTTMSPALEAVTNPSGVGDETRHDVLLGDKADNANLAGEVLLMVAMLGAMATSLVGDDNNDIDLMGDASLMSSLVVFLALFVTSPRTGRPPGPVKRAGFDAITVVGKSRGVSRLPL